MALESIADPKECSYAILSHTWGRGELSFQDMADLEAAKAKEGFSKIEQTCSLASQRGYKYTWVDTCCIDKESSAELSEAINSMFAWYRLADVCFAYLADVVYEPAPFDDGDDLMNTNFPSCRWFTRGWTLQELIAPAALEFYDSGWHLLGTKRSLLAELSDITWVNAEVLEDIERLQTVPVARRMSWAARRQTTRQEDLAYCLLGIFDVNMPMIYGEGPKAFLRLQEEIVKENNDLSLFAWCAEDGADRFRGLLARSPSEFRRCSTIERHWDYATAQGDVVLANARIRIDSYLAMGQACEYVLDLHCQQDMPSADGSHSSRCSVGIPLAKTPIGFVRIRPDIRFYMSNSTPWVGRPAPVYVQKEVSRAAGASTVFPGNERSFGFIFESNTKRWAWKSQDLEARPANRWDEFQQLFMTASQTGFTGVLEFFLTYKGRVARERRKRRSGSSSVTSSASTDRGEDTNTASTATGGHVRCLLACGCAEFSDGTDDIARSKRFSRKEMDEGADLQGRWAALFVEGHPQSAQIFDLYDRYRGVDDASLLHGVRFILFRRLRDRIDRTGRLDRARVRTLLERKISIPIPSPDAPERALQFTIASRRDRAPNEDGVTYHNEGHLLPTRTNAERLAEVFYIRVKEYDRVKEETVRASKVEVRAGIERIKTGQRGKVAHEWASKEDLKLWLRDRNSHQWERETG